MFVRTRFQYGSLRLRKRERSSDVWEFRYYETNPEGKRMRQSAILGDRELYPTEVAARRATQALLMQLNEDSPRAEVEAPTFGALLDRYIEHELPERFSTRKSHLSNIRKHIRPRWNNHPVDKLKPMAMEQWLRDLALGPKSKTHIRSLMHLILKCGERWGVIEIGKNPVALVSIKDASKRLKRPQILEVGQFFEMLKHLPEPYRTMVMVAQCTGLRISEILGLKWGDFDFEAHTCPLLFLVLFISDSSLWGQSVPASTPTSPMASRLDLIHRAAEQTDPMPELEQLCDVIGPRLTGSVAALYAEQQVLAHMREIGLQGVHGEAWTLPRGWQRGPAAASLATPFRMPIPIAAYGWTGSTPKHSGPVPVVLIDANEVAEHLDALVRSQGKSWSGKALLISSNPDKPLRAYAQLLPLLQAATAAHAIAVFRHDTRPGNGIVHSEPLAVVLPETIDPNLLPVVDLPIEHQKLIVRLLRLNRPVNINIDVENSFTGGPVVSNNLVGEIPGATHPEEIVLVSAHLDSWDLGTGATDDAFGTAAVLGAAQSLIRAGLRPERTLRFVFFTGEEEGLLGSRAYVRQHAAELSNIVATFALDWGAGPIVQLPTAGHPELLPLLTRFNKLTPELHLQSPNDGWLFMTDAYAFTLAGLPGIAPLVRAPGYFEQAHSAEDTLDKVSSSDLPQAMTVLAMASFFLADTQDIPQGHFTPAQTAAALTQGKQKPMLDAFGLWPFQQ